MSSIRKSMSLESRWRMARICSAPSDADAGMVAGAAAGRGAPRRERPSAAATSSGIAPLKRIAKKLRNASKRRSKLKSPISQNTLGIVGQDLILPADFQSACSGRVQRVREADRRSASRMESCPTYFFLSLSAFTYFSGDLLKVSLSSLLQK